MYRVWIGDNGPRSVKLYRIRSNFSRAVGKGVGG